MANLIQFAVLVKTIETTDTGKMHTSHLTMDAASFKDAFAMARAMNNTTNSEVQRVATVCFVISTRQGRNFFPADQIDEIMRQITEAKDQMQADPGPLTMKKSLTHSY